MIKPVRINIIVSAKNPINPQTWCTACSLSAEILVFPIFDIYRPKAQIANIPLTPISVFSAKKNRR